MVPQTSSLVPGDVVPIPTLPPLNIVILLLPPVLNIICPGAEEKVEP